LYVELIDINKSFGTEKVSDHVSFGIEKGKLVGLLGPSGGGKTTILRMIAGLEDPDSGEIRVDGKVVNQTPAGERGIGFVFQNYALFRYMTVYENIAFGLRVQKENKRKIDERVKYLIRLIGLDGLEDRYPAALSGGQRQRVAFARALAPGPQLLLLDEPFAAIDAKVRKELRSWLKEMIRTLGITSIFVTHDQDEAIEVADEIIIINQGRIEQKGTPVEIYKKPATDFAATFFGDGVWVRDYSELRSFPWVQGLTGALIRPEYVRISKKSEDIKYQSSASEGVVEDVSFRGNSFEIRVRVGDLLLRAGRGPDEAPLDIKETVDVFIYRILAIKGREVFLLENEVMKDDSLII